MTSLSHYDSHHGVVINRAEFDICTPSNSDEVKAHVRTYVHTHVETELRFL